MHRLNVSRDVLSGIRARRQGGEETEDQVLRRLLSLPAAPAAPQPGHETAGAGFRDTTYGILFPEGFEISRTYKGRPFGARVSGGRWLLDADGRLYDSINQLSQAVIDGNENAWMFWFHRGPDGGRRRIAELRDPAMVRKRPRRNRRPGPASHLPQALPQAVPEAVPEAARQENISPNGAASSVPWASRPSPPELAHPSPPGGSLPGGQGGGMAWQTAPKPRETKAPRA